MLTSVLRYDELGDLTEGPVTVGISPEHIVLYDAETGERLAREEREVMARG